MMSMRSLLMVGGVLISSLCGTPCVATTPLLLQHPTLSATSIAFDYAGSIWVVPRSGGEARRLVGGPGQQSNPHFSPDGTSIAYTGTRGGNTDVYVVAAAGGDPTRLTYHPASDVALGWTPDGRSVLFSSHRETQRDLAALYTVPAAGGVVERLPLPSGNEGSYSPDGTHIAYSPFDQWQPAWKRYRGGQTARIWIADLADSHVERIPRENSNDRNPVWVGDSIYFLSDRNGRVSLFAYDLRSRQTREVVRNAAGFDINSLQAGPGALVFSQFGALRLFDTASGEVRPIAVSIAAELPERRAAYAKIAPQQILHAAISPTGKRVLLEARGEILTVPAEKGDARNLTKTPGVADRDPAWSPDGKSVAWFSDASGEYALNIRSPDGLGPVRVFSLGEPPSYFYSPRWSPDSRKIAYSDKRLNLWILDLDHPTPVKVDTDRHDAPWFQLDPAWSPDSAWLVYARVLPSHLHAAFAYSLATHRSRQLTDGLSDVSSPRFDRSGKYLYFIAGTGTGLGAGWLDMSSRGRVQTSSAYITVLRNDIPSPLAPESDEETPAERPVAKPAKEGAATADASPARTRIDFDGLDQRILALPVPRAKYSALETGGDGIVFLGNEPEAVSDEAALEEEEEAALPQDIVRFDLKSRKSEPFAKGVDGGSFGICADGSHVLFARKSQWSVVASDKAPKDGDGALKLDDLSVWVDPVAEWQQMYHEVWRIERDFFYDPGFHGLDLAAAERTYAPFLAGIASRDDLNRLFQEMTGHLSVGHTFISGGATPDTGKENVGLLGADLRTVNGHFQFAKILEGENWNPSLVAPLTKPGVNVKEGEFLLAVNGQPVIADGEVSRYLLGLAGKQTVLTVGPRADGGGSRQVTIVPIASERNLRLRTWMEGNRRTVDRLSAGRLAYVYLPDTAAGGFANFNRYYFAQVGKQGAVLDERFNHGGQIADFIVEQLKRTPLMIDRTREGEETIEPAQAIFGPKVMIINQMSGSGGDALPWLFHKAGVGPLVGVRTWGGLVGIGYYPPLIDGGNVTAPRWALYGTEGQWEVENIGIAPDVEVEQDPALVRQGHDPQLERAVAVALEALQKSPPPSFVRPAPPRYPSQLPEVR